MATALDVIQRFTNAVGIPEPDTGVANPADDVVQMVELLNQECRDLSRRHDWQALTFEATFTTVATQSQGTLSSLIGATQQLRRIVNETIWNRTTQQPVIGPVSRREWQARMALSLSGPYSQYRIRGNELLFDPVPAAGDTCAFDYVSKCWCTDSGGTTYRANVAADTDILLLDEEIIQAGLEWRWLRKKGLSYAEEFATYEGMVKRAIGDDGTRRRLNMADSNTGYRPGVFVPIANWPV